MRPAKPPTGRPRFLPVFEAAPGQDGRANQASAPSAYTLIGQRLETHRWATKKVLAPGPRDYFTKQLPGVAAEFLQLHLLDWREIVGASRDSDAGQQHW